MKKLSKFYPCGKCGALLERSPATSLNPAFCQKCFKAVKKALENVHIEGPGGIAKCGLGGVTTVTRAWGYWGPGGEGFKDVCKECLATEEEGK